MTVAHKTKKWSTFMCCAMHYAYMGLRNGEVPIGSVVVFQGKVIAGACNAVIKNQDPTAHAEIESIRKACKYIGNYRLPECDMYVTIQPCQMCLAAIKEARIRNIYFGWESFYRNGHKSSLRCLRREESLAVLLRFFQEKRKLC